MTDLAALRAEIEGLRIGPLRFVRDYGPRIGHDDAIDQILAILDRYAAEPLDVERLAAAITNTEAIKNGYAWRYADFDEEEKEQMREEARWLVAEYAALAKPGDPA